MCSIIVSFDLYSVSSDFRQHSTLYVCFSVLASDILTETLKCEHLSFDFCRGFFFIAAGATAVSVSFTDICVAFGRGCGCGFGYGFGFAFDLRCLIVGVVCGSLFRFLYADS